MKIRREDRLEYRIRIRRKGEDRKKIRWEVRSKE